MAPTGRSTESKTSQSMDGFGDTPMRTGKGNLKKGKSTKKLPS